MPVRFTRFINTRQFMEPSTSQGSVATCARYGEIPNDHLTANLVGWGLFQRKYFENRLRFDRIVAVSLVRFWPTMYSLRQPADDTVSTNYRRSSGDIHVWMAVYDVAIRDHEYSQRPIVYRESKKTRHQTLGHNFTNYYPIFKNFSVTDSVVNLQQIHV